MTAMDTDVLQLTRQALWLVLVLASPPVVAAAVVGLLIALLQAATQLQEQTFQYMAKFFVTVLALFLTSSLIGTMLFRYTDRIFSEFPNLLPG